MFLLGLVLLLIGVVVAVAVERTLGLILLLIGAVLLIVGVVPDADAFPMPYKRG